MKKAYRFLRDRPFGQLLIVPISCAVLALIGLLIYNAYMAGDVLKQLREAHGRYEYLESTVDNLRNNTLTAVNLLDENVRHPPVDPEKLSWVVADLRRSIDFLPDTALKQVAHEYLEPVLLLEAFYADMLAGASYGSNESLPSEAQNALQNLLFHLEAVGSESQIRQDPELALQVTELQFAVLILQTVMDGLLIADENHQHEVEILFVAAKGELTNLRSGGMNDPLSIATIEQIDRRLTQMMAIATSFYASLATGDAQFDLTQELMAQRGLVQADLIGYMPQLKAQLDGWKNTKQTQFEQEVTLREKRDLIVAGVVLLCVIVILLYLVQTLKRRVDVLVRAANRYAGGELTYRWTMQSADEFETLSRSLKQMGWTVLQKQRLQEYLMGKLRESEQSVREMNRTLEQQVEARTQQLSHSLEELEQEVQRRKEAEKQLQELAFYDSLTGLPNRMLFYERLRHWAAYHQRGKSEFALLFIDLDRFKEVNDTLGHEAGDILLKEVASRLNQCVLRASDTVARLGGDEFTVILTELKRQQDCLMVCERIIEQINRPIAIAGQRVTVGCSIGVAYSTVLGCEATVLCRQADAAMYQAKAAGRNAWRVADSVHNVS